MVVAFAVSPAGDVVAFDAAVSTLVAVVAAVDSDAVRIVLAAVAVDVVGSFVVADVVYFDGDGTLVLKLDFAPDLVLQVSAVPVMEALWVLDSAYVAIDGILSALIED